MITDPRFFDDAHPPRRLLHREAAVDQLSRAWEPAVVGNRAEDVLIHGPSGVGKTVLARHSLKKLTAEADVHCAHVDCMGKTTAGVVRSVLHDLPGADPASNTPQEDLCNELHDRIENPGIVVLDEADDLPATDALDRLADVDGLSLCVICHHQEDWLARVDSSVRRRLSLRPVGIDRYGVSELADILAVRARQGLRPGSVTREQLEAIADRVAGVARKGIQSLRQAAIQAEQRGHDTISDQDVADSYELALRRILRQNLRSLPFHHQLLYELIRMGDGLEPTELHDRYDRIADEVYHGRDVTPISKRARRTKLTKLKDYDLIEVEGENRHRVYQVCDEEVMQPLALNLQSKH